MIGLALEGGGSRGSYQIGVIRAYIEAGFNFTGFVGSSIGAINAAVIAQGDFEKAAELWPNLTTEQLFNADAYKLLRLGESKWDMSMLSDAREGLKKITDERGIDTSRIREFIEENVSEEKVRASGYDFGLVTVSIHERRPYELFLEDIEQGELLPYLAASACVPGFQSVVIGKNSFIDGSLYNSCPINMLIKKGYKEIIAVRTKALGVYRKIDPPKDVNVRIISPKCDLGNMMIFSPEKIKDNIRIGYKDGLESLGE